MISKNEIKDFILESTMGGALTSGEMIFNLIVTFFLVMVLYWLYKKTYDGILYSKNFNITLILTGMVTSLAVMAISGNIALSLGMVGALSIVRFRSAIREPKDVGFLFWSVTLGILCGVGYYKLAVVSTLIISTILLVFSKKFIVHQPYLLVIKYNKLKKNELNSLLKSKCNKQKLRTSSISKDNKEITFEIKLKEHNSMNLLEEINQLEGIEFASIVSYDGRLESM